MKTVKGKRKEMKKYIHYCDNMADWRVNIYRSPTFLSGSINTEVSCMFFFIESRDHHPVSTVFYPDLPQSVHAHKLAKNTHRTSFYTKEILLLYKLCT